jgi:TonB family protein
MVELSIYRKKSRLYGLLCALFITGSIITVFVLYVIHTPNPPYPETGGGGTGNGIELNLGFSDLGSGSTPSEDIASPENVTPPADNSEEAKIATQDMEDAPVIQEASKNTKKDIKKEIKKDITKTTKKVSQVEKAAVKQTVNANALYKPRQGSDGTTKTPGDQGSPDGDIGAKAFGKGGKGGSGGGSGGGIGTGIGTGIGSGVSYTLEGRNIDQAPSPAYNGQEEGYVMIEITVNKDGVVTQAIFKLKGSSTSDSNLVEAARQAALKSKFNRKPDAPAFQKGTIRYRFKLQ